MTYVRRFRMEIDLRRRPLSTPVLPDGYRWLAWDEHLLDRHAAAKYESFRFEVDSRVFPALGHPEGCRRLMSEIAGQRSFLPESTWLVTYQSGDGRPPVDCGTIQGLVQGWRLGAVQNVGVVPRHRGHGLGRALVLKCLEGFRSARLRRVYLEVTAENTAAVELYRSLGFRLVRTMYKPLELDPVAG